MSRRFIKLKFNLLSENRKKMMPQKRKSDEDNTEKAKAYISGSDSSPDDDPKSTQKVEFKKAEAVEDGKKTKM